MERSISMKMKTVKASTANPNGKTPPGNKSLGLQTTICFYEIEYIDKTDEVEESEIHNSSLTASKQNLVKSNFPYID